MSLAPGTRLGPYEIVVPLGAGGMGEVYRARDARLGRDVAIKVLPQHLSDQPEVRARFEREAKTVSSLNHPHICTLFDVGREGVTDYLVMELVEGETLAARLARGALPAGDVLRIGGQIADALDRAHRAGVVHRDLKPANVMLTKSGAKLMDFGLARATGLASGTEGATAMTQSPTIAQPLTAEGSIVGTFQYMAPEQLEGREADARSDLWALGCVLYEMATGRRAFQGGTQASLISAIMRDAPRPMTELAPLSPPALERLVMALLAKDPEERLQTAHDVKLQLAWAGESPSGATASVPARARSRSRWIVRGVTAAAIVAALALGALVMAGRGGRERIVRASIAPPEGATFGVGASAPVPLALSPDGRTLVLCAREGEGPIRLWVRPLSGGEARPLDGTEDAHHPFFSPDGRSIGFFAESRLKRVDVAGGPVTVLAAVPEARGGTWNRQGVILFTPAAAGPVMRVSAEGGSITPATRLDSTLGESTHRYPCFLPDGRHFLYLARRTGAGAGVEPTIYAASLDRPGRKRIVGVASNVAFASGYLIYVRQGQLVAQPFDPGRLATTGPARALIDDVRMDERFSRADFAVSANGMLACFTGKIVTQSRLRWLDRTGAELGAVGDPAPYTYGGAVFMSRDGRSACVPLQDEATGVSALSIVDLATGRRRLLRVGERDLISAAWTPDGRRIATTLDEGNVVVLVAADGSGRLDTLARIGGREFISASSISPDGRWLLLERGSRGPTGRTEAIPIGAHDRILPLSSAGTEDNAPGFSPDGRFVAFVSEVSGRFEVFVAPFPPTGSRWQVSQQGGISPRWNPRGGELFYFDRERRLVAVPVNTAASVPEIGDPKPLFQFHRVSTDYWCYDVAPDGSRFLVASEPAETRPSLVTLVSNWPGLIAR